MISPKAALVYSPSEQHTTKLLYNESVRKSSDRELKEQRDLDPSYKGDTETIRSVELRHDYAPTSRLAVAATAFWYAHDLIGHLPAPYNRDAPLGESRVSGLEIECRHVTLEHDLIFSHTYTRMLDFTLVDESIADQVVTSEPYGYGDDLANWSPHITKLYARQAVGRGFSANGSLRLFWGFPGAEDYTAYNNEVLKARNRSQSDGRTDAFGASIFVNLGVSYDRSENMRLGLQLHNVLGWVDKDLNKRNYFARMAGYRSVAAAASLNLSYAF